MRATFADAGLGKADDAVTATPDRLLSRLKPTILSLFSGQSSIIEVRIRLLIMVFKNVG